MTCTFLLINSIVNQEVAPQRQNDKLTCTLLYVLVLYRKMNFEEIACESTNTSATQFWRAIAIWIKNPHVVNRRILASQELLTVEVNCSVSDIFKSIEKLQIQPEHFECDLTTKNVKYLLDVLNIAKYCKSMEYIGPIGALDNNLTYLLVKKLLPRNTQLFSPTLEFIFIDKKSISIISFHKCIVQDRQSLGPNTTYKIQHHEYGSTYINIHKSEDQYYDSSCDWLKSKFFPRLIKWMMNESDNVSPKISSLSLVSAEKYTLLYNQLKEKYGTEMVKVWPENTDPAKFVYEDVAIATYLLLLWEKERLEKGTQDMQSFVDLGCGMVFSFISCPVRVTEEQGLTCAREKYGTCFQRTLICRHLNFYIF